MVGFCVASPPPDFLPCRCGRRCGRVPPLSPGWQRRLTDLTRPSSGSAGPELVLLPPTVFLACAAFANVPSP